MAGASAYAIYNADSSVMTTSTFTRTAASIALMAAVACAASPLVAQTRSAPLTEIRYLSGTGTDDAVHWDFRVTGGMRSGEWTTIRVPSNWETEGFGTYNYGGDYRAPNVASSASARERPGFADEQGHYRLAFDAPTAWRNKTIRLVFEGVMTRAEVTVNGKPAGPAHEGSFYRFSYDITPLMILGGANQFEIIVSKVAQNESVNRAERQGDYWNFGGIFRPVFLEVLPAHYVDWTGIDARADGTFRADVHFGSPALSNTRVTGQLIDAIGRPVGVPFSTAVAAGDTRARVETTTPNPRLWTAETPNLYSVRFTLERNGTAVHVVTERFGFRTFEVRPGDGLYLNGSRIVLKGVNRHSQWADTGRALSRRLNYDDARLIKDMNMNAVRMSHYPPDKAFLEACDELGLYVLNELAGWQGAYDTPTGARLIGQLVRRDVNHPSILFWDNGNEGGWNTDNDGEFAKWDIQARPVLHPWHLFGGVQTDHYPTYAEVLKHTAAADIFMPTEILHGLYDGGIGAGMRDYWDVMKKDLQSGGMFFWVFADDGVVRTDLDGRVDSRGDLGPDGIVGPRREKEGSFYTIKELWSPVEVDTTTFVAGRARQELPVTNHYDFLNLRETTFSWELGRFASPAAGRAGHTVTARGVLAGPDVAPHATGALRFSLPASFESAHVFYLTARDRDGRNLWTWSWPLGAGAGTEADGGEPTSTVNARETAAQWIVTANGAEWRFSKEAGQLVSLTRQGRTLAVGGPRMVAYALAPTGSGGRGGGPGSLPPNITARTLRYADVSVPGTLTNFVVSGGGSAAVTVTAEYSGTLKRTQWTVASDGVAELEYTYDYAGPASLLGVTFDVPEAAVRGITWLGEGPYRVWQNRMEGTRLDVWRTAYNDPVPSVSYTTTPEFKGYFRGWRWATLDSTAGPLTLSSTTTDSFLGVFTPKDGPVGSLLQLPETGLAVLDVIPAIRDKFIAPRDLGPQSAERTMAGPVTRRVRLGLGP